MNEANAGPCMAKTYILHSSWLPDLWAEKTVSMTSGYLHKDSPLDAHPLHLWNTVGL